MIPEVAVEAAARVLEFHLTDRAQDSGCALRCGYSGDEMPTHLAQHIIEAAAPHMLAEAKAVGWDEGYNLAQCEAFCDVDDETRNPYRPTT